MIPFAVRAADDDTYLGLALSDDDLATLRANGNVIKTMESCALGFWITEDDGKRVFVQPRNSKVVIIAGNDTDEIGEFLQVDLNL